MADTRPARAARAPAAFGLLFVLATPIAAPLSQEIAYQPVSLPSVWVQGFAKDLGGHLFSYPSAYPGQMRALLTRTTDGKMGIEWEAEAPPAGPPEEIVHFIWHAGLASGYGAHRFTLSLNGTPMFVFRSGRDTHDPEWSVKGVAGAMLGFKTTRVGNFNELFGLMVLSVPRRLAGPGRPRLSVVGEAAQNQDYYMVFLEGLRDWARVEPEEAVLTGGRRALRVEVSRIANEANATLTSGGTTLWSGVIGSGHTSLFVPAPGGAGPASPAPGTVGPASRRSSLTASQLPVTLTIGGQEAVSTTLLLTPVRPWEIHLLPHSHVDIGYSDPQPEVERKQWKNLRDAVELARKTASYPAEARFRWNVEGLWSVESYLRQAPAEERRAFVDAVKQGSIGLQANYTNVLTGLMSPEELSHWTDAARQLRVEHGLPPARSAMHADIPGLSWTSVRALAEGGVRYFSSGPNYMPGLPDRGDRIGQTLNALADKPFWWVSPSGRDRLLFWMAGRGYSWFHGMNMGSLSGAGRTALLDYLRELRDTYPWDMVQVRYTIGGDNGPVDPKLPDIVQTWNETFDAPRLVINTAEAMFAEFERRHGAKLPSYAGDMTPYWEDGAVSSAAEEAMARASAKRLVQAETVWSLRNPSAFPERDAAEAWRQVLLWHEHTWGAADSISAPDRADVVAQWTYKRQFALEADRRSKALLEAALGTAVPTGSGTGVPPVGRGVPPVGSVQIVNTLSWPRSGVVLVPKAFASGDRVTDALGRARPSQRLKSGELAVLAASVPALGAATLSIRDGAPTLPPVPVTVQDGTVLDNGVVRVVVDASTGDVRSLRWTGAAATEFVSTSGGLNSYQYVPGRDPALARGSGPAHVVVEEGGPLVATLRVESAAPGARSLVRRVTLIAGEREMRLEDLLDKTLVRAKESAHIAFPLALANVTIRVDEGAALVVPERNQLPGSCRDFIGASAVDLSTATFGLSIATLDAPLIEIGAITDERQGPAGVRSWRTTTAPGATVYAYLLNNYWHTNYKADQEGMLRVRFVLAPHGAFDAVALRRFGAGHEQPLLVATGPTAARLPFTVSGQAVVLSSIRPAGKDAFVVRLYNASPVSSTTTVAPSGTGAIGVSVIDGNGGAKMLATAAITLRGFETVLLRIRQGPAGGR